MMTLRQLADEPPTLPTQTAWYLADLAEARGKQELFIRHSPQKKPRSFTCFLHSLLYQLMTAQICVHDLDLFFLEQETVAS